MKARFLIVLGLVLAFALLAACAPAAAPTQAPPPPAAATQAPAPPPAATQAPSGVKPVIKVWYKKEFTDKIDALVKKWTTDFEKANNVTVDLTFITMADAPTKYVAAIESGTTPNVAMVPFWGPPRYYNMGALEDVSDLFVKIGAANGGWLDAAQVATKFDGKYWGVPENITTEPLFMRTDIMKQLGYTDRPKTFDELAKFAADATKLGAGKYYGWGVDYNRSDDGHLGTQMLLWNFGSRTTAEDGKTITFNSPESIAACKYMKDVYQYAPPGAIGWTDSSNNEAWAAGKIAMTQNGPSIWYALKQPGYLPEAANNTHMYDWPTGPKGDSATIAEVFSWVVFKDKDPQKVELSKKFIELTMLPENYDTLAELSWAQESPPHNRGMSSAFMNQPDFADFRKQLARTRVQGWPGPYSVAAADVASQYVFPDMMVSVISGGKTCEQAVTDAEAKIKAIYAKYNK